MDSSKTHPMKMKLEDPEAAAEEESEGMTITVCDKATKTMVGLPWNFIGITIEPCSWWVWRWWCWWWCWSPWWWTRSRRRGSRATPSSPSYRPSSGITRNLFIFAYKYKNYKINFTLNRYKISFVRPIVS